MGAILLQMAAPSFIQKNFQITLINILSHSNSMDQQDQNN